MCASVWSDGGFYRYPRSQDLSSLGQIQDGGLSCRKAFFGVDQKSRLTPLKNLSGFTYRDYCVNEVIGSDVDILIKLNLLLLFSVVQHN